MAFEVFRRGSRAITKKAMISIGKRGAISLNRAAFTLLGGDPDAAPPTVEIMYDPEKKIVGLRISDPDGANSFQIRKANQSATYLLAGSAFTNYYDIPIGDSSTRYHAHDYGDGVVGFSLEEDAAT